MVNTEKFLHVDGLRIRYLEEGRGPDVLLLHGASLGSSADVWERSLAPLADYGFRTIAFDQPGFGLSDDPPDYSVAYRERFIPKFMDALNIEKAHLVGHSQAGRIAVSLALKDPARIAKVVVLGTGTLLPPLGDGEKQTGPTEGDGGTISEPTLDDTRALLQADLFNHSLITPEVLETRHRMSLGKNFRAFGERRRADQPGEREALWQRLDQVPVPMLMIYGSNDRGSAAERTRVAKKRSPALNLHVLDRCKHLIQWDAHSEFLALTADFLAGGVLPEGAASLSRRR